MADPSEEERYGYEVDRQRSPWEVDLRPMIRHVVRDLLARVPSATISARFHNTLTAATVEIVRAAAGMHGPLPVVLTGGCLQNARLAESVAGELASRFPVYLHRQVPPGDGGLALGQAVVAAAIARRLMK
jgi:hydrogenase maturation protein HypF